MGAAAVSRFFLIAILIVVFLRARAIEASPLERVFLPEILSSSCSDLCGYCAVTELDHPMGC